MNIFRHGAKVQMKKQTQRLGSAFLRLSTNQKRHVEHPQSNNEAVLVCWDLMIETQNARARLVPSNNRQLGSPVVARAIGKKSDAGRHTCQFVTAVTPKNQKYKPNAQSHWVIGRGEWTQLTLGDVVAWCDNWRLLETKRKREKERKKRSKCAHLRSKPEVALCKLQLKKHRH